MILNALMAFTHEVYTHCFVWRAVCFKINFSYGLPYVSFVAHCHCIDILGTFINSTNFIENC